jgi:hypothetical protein
MRGVYSKGFHFYRSKFTSARFLFISFNFMFSIFFVQAFSVPDIFYNKNPCDCDVTDKCDEYCCCDPDCTEDAINNFTQRFCLKQSIEPMTLISCDNKGQISKSNKLDSITIADKVCYIYKRTLTDSDKIINYNANEVGLPNYVDFVPSPRIPGEVILDSLSNRFFQENITSKPMYVPYGVSSYLCNSMILVLKDKEYNTKCTYPSTEAINTIVGQEVYTGSETTGNLLIKITGENKTVVLDATSPNLSFSLSTTNTDTNGDEILTTTKGGYASGLNLVGVNSSQALKFFTFDGEKVGFGTNVSVFAATNINKTSGDYFEDLNLSTSYGPVDSQGAVESIPIPPFSLVSGDRPKSVIYTLMFKKFGYVDMFYYKFIGIDLQIVNSSSDYHTIRLHQIELSDSGTSEEEPQVGSAYSVSIYDITSFMFKDSSDTETTLGIITFCFIIVLIWLDALFVD